MHWVYLIIAGVLEVGWIYSLKFTEGFTRLLPILSYALFGAGAAFFLSLSLKVLPVGITYAIWTGIAIAGSNVVGMLIFEEPYRFLQLFYIFLILFGVAGLQISSMR
ncbi:MAG: multidrug efflux SMR transporter [Nitrospirota bacterium]|nr:multidrug efflux SMR transporter [Nitrospirota bacterium]